MKIELGKQPLARNGDEQDLIDAKHVLCIFSNDPNPARATKKRMIRRLRRSSKLIVKNELMDHGTE